MNQKLLKIASEIRQLQDKSASKKIAGVCSCCGQYIPDKEEPSAEATIKEKNKYVLEMLNQEKKHSQNPTYVTQVEIGIDLWKKFVASMKKAKSRRAAEAAISDFRQNWTKHAWDTAVRDVVASGYDAISKALGFEDIALKYWR